MSSEAKWTYEAQEMSNFLTMLQEKDFRNAPYWKYKNVLAPADLDSIPLFDKFKLKTHGRCHNFIVLTLSDVRKALLHNMPAGKLTGLKKLHMVDREAFSAESIIDLPTQEEMKSKKLKASFIINASLEPFSPLVNLFNVSTMLSSILTHYLEDINCGTFFFVQSFVGPSEIYPWGELS